MDLTLKTRLYQTGLAVLVLLAIGTSGYYFLTGGRYDLFTCFYMTVITVTTIGFDEIIDLENHPGARPFTVFIAFAGVVILTYFVSTVSAVIIGGHYRENYKKRKMQKTILDTKAHYIVCGIDSHTHHLIEELNSTERDSVCIDINSEKIKQLMKKYPSQKYVEGDATHEDTLIKAGVKNAAGLFAATSDDNVNLVISLLTRSINPDIRIISLCIYHDNKDKILLAGADNVVSPNYIGGMRMAAEMFRPIVTSFFDTILRDSNNNLRLEQITVNENYHGKKLTELKITEFKDSLFIAIKSNDELIFKPEDDFTVKQGDLLMIMTTPLERIKIENLYL
ncbi:MAG: potassium channel protein [Bacteroidota bacterium]|nr:potassium channel protein [Bacteroidota bacterium]